jgi:hypothetical protein
MRTGWLVNLLLVLGVAGLLAYALYRPKADEEAAQHPISALGPETVAQVRIEPQGGAALELKKEGEDWFLLQPLRARADRTQVDRLLDILRARSREKLAAADLDRFDLQQPALRVVYEGQSVAFGTVNPLTQEQYVLAGDAVYLVSGFYRSQVPERPERLLTHALLRAGEKPLAVRLKGFAVEQRDGKWALTPAPPEAPSQDDLNRWIDDWRLASSLYTEQAKATKPPAEWIELTLANQGKLRLAVARRAPQLVLVRPDEKLAFHFSEEMAKRLLSPPVAAEPAAAEPDAAAPQAGPGQ